MAKAQVTLPGGAIVQIEGTADEVADLLAKFQGTDSSVGTSKEPASKSRGGRQKKKTSRRGAEGRSQRSNQSGPQEKIRALKTEDFFKQRRTINDVRNELERKGHIYPVTALSTPLLRLVRAHELRRLRESDQWVYVNP